jgi:hypothetical protein
MKYLKKGIIKMSKESYEIVSDWYNENGILVVDIETNYADARVCKKDDIYWAQRKYFGEWIPFYDDVIKDKDMQHSSVDAAVEDLMGWFDNCDAIGIDC